MSFGSSLHQFSYQLGEIDFGAAEYTRAIIGPKGRSGTLKEIHVSVTQDCTHVTTGAKVQVGITDHLDKFADFDLGAVTAPAGVSAAAVGKVKHLEVIPADTQVLVTLLSPTGGSPVTGKGYVTIVINWV